MTDVLTEFLYKYRIQRCPRCHWKIGTKDVVLSNVPTLTVNIACLNCGKHLIGLKHEDEWAEDWIQVLTDYVETEWKRK